MKRVLHIITRLIVGGAQENTMYTAAMLDKERFHVEVISGPQTGSEGSLIEEVQQKGIPLHILPSLVRQISPLQDLITLWHLVRFLRQNGFDIVHTHSSKAGILGRLAAFIAGTPHVIHTIHGWSFHDHMPRPVRNVYILLERLCARLTDFLIVVAKADIEKGLSAGIGRQEQYHLFRSAIPLSEFGSASQERSTVREEFGIPPQAVVIGNVGRFSLQKNPLDWVCAAGEIGRKHNEVRFLLVGDGPLQHEVRAQLEFEGIVDRTVLTGLRRDVARLMSAMDIFLLTSLWEGLPRVIPQAMCVGLPVVAYKADGTTEAIQDAATGFLCTPGDIKKVVEVCSYLIDNAEERKSMGLRGQAYAQKEFDLSVMIAQIERLYDSLAQ